MSDPGDEGRSSLWDRAVGDRRAAAALGMLIASGLGLGTVASFAPSYLPAWMVCGNGGLLLVPVYFFAVGLCVWVGAGPLPAIAAAFPLFITVPFVIAYPPFFGVPALLVVCLPGALSYGLGAGLRRVAPPTSPVRRVFAVGTFVATFSVLILVLAWLLSFPSGSPPPGPPNVVFEASYNPDSRTLNIRHAGGDSIREGRVVVQVNGSRQGVHLVANRTNTSGVWYDADAPAAATGPITFGDSVQVTDVAERAEVIVYFSDRSHDRCVPSRSGTIWVWRVARR
ncbi:MAG: hypothetical protein ABEH77_06885 [Halobacteriaceae archaeon]